MRSARLSSLVLLAAVIAGGLVVQAADGDDRRAGDVTAPVVEPGVAMPAARPEPTLASTWFCAGGTARPGSSADHTILVTNPTDRPRTATVTVLTGAVAPAPEVVGEGEADGGEATTTSEATTTTAEPTTTTRPEPASTELEVPAQSLVSYRLGDLSEAQLAGAVVEIDGGEVAVEHQVSGELGRATAPCSTTSSATWSFPWGVTERGARELLVFMNPFPDDATVDIDFATDEGVRETSRFQGFVVPGRSVVGAYVDEDVTRKAQVSAQVRVRGGRLIVDRIQTFDGTDHRRGITLGLGAPVPAETWIFPDGGHEEGTTEQVVVFNPTEEVAEVEVEVRLDDPEANGVPEPYALTVLPGRYGVVDLHSTDDARVPAGVGHSTIVRSLNEVPVAAERVMTATEPSDRRGVGATLGAPLGAPTWYFAGGGTGEARDEWIVLFNVSDEVVTYDVTALAGGQTLAVQDLQRREIPANGRVAIRMGDKVERETLPLVISADGPIVAERGLYRVGGLGISQSMGIPLADGVVVPDPVDG